MSVIEVINLKKCYGEKEALQGISFAVDQGEIFGFLGPNGAGKTTTIRILAGQLRPNSGEARILGRDVFKGMAEIQPKMGVVPEKANLYERLSVKENLEFFCRLYGCPLSNADRYLELVNLAEEKKTQVKKLSKGMKQRVLLARALLHEPAVLFLDEPTAGLDPASASNIHQLLKRLNAEGMTILLTTHNMEEVDILCRQVAFLDRGLIAASGLTSDLKLQHATKEARVLVKIGERVEEKTIALQGEESARLVAGWIAEGSLETIHSCEPTLADIFVRVTGRDLQ